MGPRDWNVTGSLSSVVAVHIMQYSKLEKKNIRKLIAYFADFEKGT